DSDSSWTEETQCDTVVVDFTSYAEKWKFSRRGNETALGRFLSRVCPHIQRTQKRVSVEDYDHSIGRSVMKKKRVYFYNFGSLGRCRAEWEKIHGPVKWETDESGFI